MIKNTKEFVSAVPDSREEIVADSKLFAVIILFISCDSHDIEPFKVIQLR